MRRKRFIDEKITITHPYALASLILTILLVTIPVIYAFGEVNNKINTFESEIDIHLEESRIIESKITESDKERAVILQRLNELHQDMQEVKTDVKVLLQK